MFTRKKKRLKLIEEDLKRTEKVLHVFCLKKMVKETSLFCILGPDKLTYELNSNKIILKSTHELFTECIQSF